MKRVFHFSVSVIIALFPLHTASGQTVARPDSPDLVVPTNGINLGITSFYDGFSADRPGVTLLQYVRINNLNAIKDRDGNKSAAFQRPRINTATSITQLSLATPYTIDGNRLALDLLVPITHIDSRFGSEGLQLSDNGTGLGDIIFGMSVQFKPVMRGPRPIASVRVALNAIAPTGGFSRTRDLNQSSGYWSVNPYVAWTVLPAPGWEISGRTQYLYNFSTKRISNPPNIPNLTIRDGQAGQLVYTNLTASREVTRGMSLGINSFLVQQINENRLNGQDLPGTKRSAIYAGPGVHLNASPDIIVNANLYLPISVRNYPAGPQINFQIIKPIR